MFKRLKCGFVAQIGRVNAECLVRRIVDGQA